MKYLKRYNDFLLEAVLNIDTSLIDKLRSYEKRDDVPDTWKKISSLVLQFVGKDSIKNRFDMVSIDSDSSKKLLVKTGKQNNSQSIAKVIRNILISYNVNLEEYQIKDDTIQKFSDDLIGKIESISESKGDIKIVSGDDIKYWYNSENNEKVKNTELYQSCMRGKMDQLDIYSKNPDNIKLLIKLNSDGKLVARALLWKLDYSSKGYDWFLDRVYFNNSTDKSLLFNWIKSQSGYENINRKVDNFELIDDLMIVNLKNVLFDSYPYVDSFQLYVNRENDKFINDGFFSNVSIFMRHPRFDELNKKITNHIEFDCKKVDGFIKSADQEFNLGKLDLDGIKLIKDFSDNIKKDMLPIDEPLNELRNRINIINTLYDTNDVNSVFKLVDIKSSDNLGEDFRELDMGDNFYVSGDFKPDKNFNGYESDSSFKGMRFILYDITDLLNNDKIKEIVENVVPDTLKVNGKTYMTELDCIIIGIYDEVKKSEKYFGEEYEIRRFIIKNDKKLTYDDITDFLKNKMNLDENNELIKLRRSVVDR
jgi:hypothetical protein